MRREQELDTLSAIHTAIMSGSDEPGVVSEITRRVAEVCGAKICTIAMSRRTTTGQRPFLPAGLSGGSIHRFFPDGAPYGEGVGGWAMLHHRVAASSNVFEDPRYERMRDFAALVGFVSSAAAPVELDDQTSTARWSSAIPRCASSRPRNWPALSAWRTRPRSPFAASASASRCPASPSRRRWP